MENKELINIVNILSEERLRKAYKFDGHDTIMEALAYKAWNLALCASLYPILQIVEVCLRNSIHIAISQHFNDTNWFQNPAILQEAEINTVQQTMRNLESLHKASDASHLVSELTFGFWTGLMIKRYERKLWHPLIKNIFPYLSKRTCTRIFIFEHFKEIKKLRNRVFHHQRIWHLDNLPEKKQKIIDALYWMEPAILRFVKQVDNFKAIYDLGVGYYQDKLTDIINDCQ